MMFLTQIQLPSQTPDQVQKLVQKDLRETFATLQTPLLVDMSGGQFDTGWDHKTTIDILGRPTLQVMQRLALSMKLVATLDNGVLCFTQDPEIAHATGGKMAPMLAHWLNTLTDQQLQEFMAGPTQDKDLGTTGLFFAENANMPDPNRRTDLVNRHFSTQLGLDFFVFANGGPKQKFLTSVSAPWSNSAPAYAGEKLSEAESQLPGRTPGALDYSKGFYGPFEEVLKKAEKTFHILAFLDSRVDSANIYIQGQFTEDAFLRAAKRLATAMTPEFSTDQAIDYKSLNRRLLRAYAAAEKDPVAKQIAEDLLNGKTTFTAKDLEGMSDTSHIDGSLTLPPGETFTLTPSFSITTDTGRPFVMSDGVTLLNGHPSVTTGFGRQSAVFIWP